MLAKRCLSDIKTIDLYQVNDDLCVKCLDLVFSGIVGVMMVMENSEEGGSL